MIFELTHIITLVLYLLSEISAIYKGNSTGILTLRSH